MSPQYDPGTVGGISAVDALEFKGVWNADTNTPTLASGVGQKGDYYTVGVAGSTDLDGETGWQAADAAVFNGTAWERVGSHAIRPKVYGESEGESTITGTTDFQQKLRVSLPSSAPAGTYLIEWSYTYRHDATNTNFLAQVEIDDTTVIWSHVDEPNDTAADQRRPASSFREVVLASGAHDFDIDFATSSAGNLSGISQARLRVELVNT